MKYSELELEDDQCALIKDLSTGEIITVGELNNELGQCACCTRYSDSDFSKLDVLRIVNIKTMEVIYETKD